METSAYHVLKNKQKPPRTWSQAVRPPFLPPSMSDYERKDGAEIDTPFGTAEAALTEDMRFSSAILSDSTSSSGCINCARDGCGSGPRVWANGGGFSAAELGGSVACPYC